MANTGTESTDAATRHRVEFWLFVATVVVAIVPIVVAAVRALDGGWLPVGDDSFFVIRARDVFSADRPLLGTWTSASTSIGIDVNNPGPLLFDALAPPVAIFGGDTGIAIGAALINGLAVIGIALVAYRRGGPVLGALAMAATATLGWSMGSELLYDPWQPHALILPFLLFLMLVWALGCGDSAALPWTLGIGSLIVQTHLSYALLVPALGVWGLFGLGMWLTRRRARDPVAWPRLRTRAARVGAISLIVLVVCWIQPVVEQFTGDGPGNLTRLARSFRESDVDTAGFGYATQAVASVFSIPPFWLRPSFDETFFDDDVWQPPALGVAIATLVVVGALFAIGAWWSWRRRDRPALFAFTVVGVGLIVGFATVARAPITIFGKLTPHSSRWLWSLAAFAGFAVGAAIVRGWPRARTRGPFVVGALGVVTLMIAVATLPTAPTANGPQSQAWAIPGVESLSRQLATVDDDGPLLIDGLFLKLFDPYGAAVVAELQRRGIPFVAREPGLVRQLGDRRAYDGTNAERELSLRTGDDARRGPRGARQVALYEALTAAEQEELDDLRETVIVALGREGEVTLSTRGETALADCELPRLAAQRAAGAFDAEELVRAREVVDMVGRRLIDLDPEARDAFERYAELQTRWDDGTVGLFIGPIAGSA